MRKLTRVLLLSVFLSMCVGTAAAEEMFLIQFDLSNDFNASNISVDIVDDANPYTPGHGAGEYRITLRDAENSIFYRNSAQLSFVDLTERHPYGYERQTRESILFFARVPYAADATEFVLSQNNTELAVIDIPSQLCTSENKTCPEYCRGKNGSACNLIVEEEDDGLPMLYIVGGILALVTVGAVVYRYRERDEPAQNSPQRAPRNRRRY